ncbi:MAG: S8/S53 family peptidase, partial [bacterium]
YEPDGIDDLGDSIAIANSNDVHSLGVDGSGVRVAVWENGPTNTTDLDIEDVYTTSPSTSNHSQNVHAIIKNVEDGEPQGHAPDSLLYSANSKDLAALRWAVRDRSCTVINQSFHRSSEPGSGGLSFDDVYKDWLILRWPYPTICQAAGNYWEGDADDIDPPNSEFVNHKGFNSLAVGNHNDAATAMDSSSVFRNPDSTHGDRELPEISANGTGVEADGITMTGTSQASPAVAGIAALLQDADSTLKSWPEGCRAILMAGATRNIVNDTWWQDVVDADDAADGTGAVNALESHRIAQQRKPRNTSPSRRGWDVGKITSADFDSNKLSTFSYRVQVPSFPRLGPRHVKVALAWDSKVTALEIPVLGIELPLSSRLTVDLDLKVFDQSGNQVGYAGSWDNSFEIVEFEGSPGGVYEIRIRRWSGTDWTWFGIAWTVTGGLLDLITLSRVNPSRVPEIVSSLDDDGGN